MQNSKTTYNTEILFYSSFFQFFGLKFWFWQRSVQTTWQIFNILNVKHFYSKYKIVLKTWIIFSLNKTGESVTVNMFLLDSI